MNLQNRHLLTGFRNKTVAEIKQEFHQTRHLMTGFRKFELSMDQKSQFQERTELSPGVAFLWQRIFRNNKKRHV